MAFPQAGGTFSSTTVPRWVSARGLRSQTIREGFAVNHGPFKYVDSLAPPRSNSWGEEYFVQPPSP
jgi:hypothetical protein